MKIVSVGFFGAGVMLLAAGCSPELDRINYGEDETQWGQYVKGNYSNFKPAKTPPPAVVNRYKNQEDNQIIDASAATETVVVNDSAAADNGAVVEETTVTEVEAAAPAADAAAPAEAAPAADVVAPVADTAAAPAADTAAPAADAAVVAAPAEDEVYVVVIGDTLSHIAKKFYKDARMSDVILKANSDVLSNPNKLKPGMKLRIPRM